MHRGCRLVSERCLVLVSQARKSWCRMISRGISSAPVKPTPLFSCINAGHRFAGFAPTRILHGWDVFLSIRSCSELSESKHLTLRRERSTFNLRSLWKNIMVSSPCALTVLSDCAKSHTNSESEEGTAVTANDDWWPTGKEIRTYACPSHFPRWRTVTEEEETPKW